MRVSLGVDDHQQVTEISDMGRPSQFPPGPITEMSAIGRETYRRIFKPWYRQASQPTWLKLSQAALGDRVIHSSQLTGYATGNLLDPAPKGLAALGLFNEMLAKGEMPAALQDKWRDLQPMILPTGEVMGPAEIFLVFTGVMKVKLPEQREIPLEQEAKVTKGFGKWYRTELAKRGVDFVVEDHQRLVKTATCMKGLLSGKEVKGEALLQDLPALAKELQVTTDELWEIIAGLMAD
jgi:hypothetical protein